VLWFRLGTDGAFTLRIGLRLMYFHSTATLIAELSMMCTLLTVFGASPGTWGFEIRPTS
jgi:hypothetical protein